MKLASNVSTSLVGSMGYIAPECVEAGFRRRRVDGRPGWAPQPHFPAEKIDVYSFGKVLLVCVTGALSPRDEVAERTCGGPLWWLISHCVSQSPRDRPGCRQVVEMLEDTLNVEGADRGWISKRPKEEIWQIFAVDGPLSDNM